MFSEKTLIVLFGTILVILQLIMIGLFLVQHNKAKNFAKKIVLLIVDTLISPFAFLAGLIIPKDKKLIVFMGRNFSGFLDNIKYLYIYLHDQGYDKDYKLVFMGHHDVSLKELKKHGYEVVSFPSKKAIWTCLRARMVITDNAHWTEHNRYNMAFFSKKVQLWHGIGFKDIRVGDPKFAAAAKGIKGFFTHKLQGKLAVYDTFVSTSDFYSQEVFGPAFSPKEIVELGYPRNDVFMGDYEFKEDDFQINADMDMLHKVIKAKKKGKKIVLYAPTFRRVKQYEISSDNLDFQALSDFGEKNGIIFIFKLHPLPQYDINFSKYKNVWEYNNKKEAYPLFKYVDMMITDYSSIYMDYLLLNRPCLFFLYDYEFYTQSCRGIRDDFMELSPGEKCFTQEELFDAVYRHLILGEDEWKAKREEICDKAWKFKDGKSCERVWNYLEDKYLKK
ncbi:MAG: CDP-glycerol glycerophosphotransferase family protein [Blautia sp.]|nr:CDP-glycerol glycerophosphotransferase family protein [Blautia sp.]